jgi:hypothetical protein
MRDGRVCDQSGQQGAPCDVLPPWPRLLLGRAGDLFAAQAVSQQGVRNFSGGPPPALHRQGEGSGGGTKGVESAGQCSPVRSSAAGSLAVACASGHLLVHVISADRVDVCSSLAGFVCPVNWHCMHSVIVDRHHHVQVNGACVL